MSDASPIAKARQRLHDVYAGYAHPIQGVIIEQTRAEATGTEIDAVEQYGWERIFGEVQRQRDKKTGGLRRGEAVISPTGVQTSLPLLGMTPRQARDNNERKQAHAAGAVAEADFERRLIDIAEERMRERGIDPAVTESVIGDFIDTAEIIELRRVAA